MTNQGFTPNTAEASGGDSPLRKVDWTMIGWETEERQFTNNDGTTTTTRNVKFKMQINQVIETTEPFPWPNTTITIRYTDPIQAFNDKNRWGAFTHSGRKIFGVEQFDLNQLVGKRQVWEYAKWTMGRQLREGEAPPLDPATGQPVKLSKAGYFDDPEQQAWQIVSVEGVVPSAASAVNPQNTLDRLADLANGKTDADFYTSCIAQDWFRADETLVMQATERKLVDILVNAQKVTRDTSGVLQKV